MAQTAQLFSFGRGVKKTSMEMLELQQALALVNSQIHQAYHAFNTTSEDELIESYVFEINALHARYNYLLRRIKEAEELL